jgi:chromosome segregation ATPase
MKSTQPNGDFNQVLTDLEEIKKKIDSQNRRIEELDEDLTYLAELVNRYLKKAEKISRTDFIIVNALFFATGFLLGFGLALLFFRG